MSSYFVPNARPIDVPAGAELARVADDHDMTSTGRYTPLPAGLLYVYTVQPSTDPWLARRIYIGQRMETNGETRRAEAAPHPILACALLAAAGVAPSLELKRLVLVMRGFFGPRMSYISDYFSIDGSFRDHPWRRGAKYSIER